MRGRPRKVYLEGDAPVLFGTHIRKQFRDMVPQSVNVREEMEFWIQERWGDRKKAELSELVIKREKVLAELASIDANIRVKEYEIKKDEEFRTAVANQKKYMVHAFRQVVGISKSHGRISMKPEWITKLYGISFSVNRVNAEFSDLLLDMEAGISDEDLIVKYAIRREQKGEREDEIVKTMREEILK